MAHPIVSVVTCVLICIALNACANEPALSDRDLVRLQEEIQRKEELALSQYFNDPESAAVASMEELVSSYAAASRTAGLSDNMKRALLYDEMIARGRLSRVLHILGRTNDSKEQVRRALDMSRKAMTRGVETEAQLSSLISTIDARMVSRWKRPQ